MKDKHLFNVCPDGEFSGRQKEMDYIFARATDPLKGSPNIFLMGKRWMGKTEVLRRVHRDLFWGQAKVAPVYYQFKGYGTADIFAEDYLKEVLKQYLAFRNRETGIFNAEISLDKLERLLIDDDAYELAEFIARHREAKKSEDHTASLRNAINAPRVIALRSGIPVYLILDDLDLANGIRFKNDGPGMMKEFMEVLNSGAFSYLAASTTRKVLEGGVLNGSVEAFILDGIENETSVSMMADLCRQYNIEFDTEILTLAADKLEGNPMYIKNIIWAAHRGGRELVILKDFVDIYANELTEGNIGFALRSWISFGGPGDIRVLNACARTAEGVSGEELAEKLREGRQELGKIIGRLSQAGLLEMNLGSVRWAGDAVVKDFISFVYETMLKGRSPEEVKTFIIRDCLKKGFNFSGEKVRGRLKDEVAGALKSFNGQKVLKVLLRNHVFTARFKNGVYKIVEDKKQEDEVILPQVVGCFDSIRWEKNEAGHPILITHGFQNGRYDSGNEVVWITGVKENIAPVNLGDVENFIRRSRILRENFRATRVIRWVVGKEGFTGEAQKKLDDEGIYSTDSVQLRILKESLEDAQTPSRLKSSGGIAPNKEFEVVLPMSTKAELVAARAVEEIGTEMGFGEVALGQIKAALVEACINAFEHSRQKSNKVYLRFVAGLDRLTIHVQNGGADFDRPSSGAQAPGAGPAGLPQKRGWGIELMKGLMDEVRFETLRGGAKIVLVKFLMRNGEARDDKEA